ncbi:MAG TPA: hypothetical protein VEL76_40815 [Gemmataceae bacterium]|nr:hypothetical protein [Gemmataceae bacterium]
MSTQESLSPLAELLRGLLSEGRVVLRGPPRLDDIQRPEVRAVLEEAYADYIIGVPGPPIAFAPDTAAAAAALTHYACWFLVSRAQPEGDLQKTLVLPVPSASPSDHLSADLTFRFLPQVHRRAKAFDPADRLTELLAVVLRQWPLTGVLSAVEEPPLAPLDFGDHPGLLLLYAERWAVTRKTAWLPRGKGFEHLERVWHDLGHDRAALPHPLEGGKVGE